MLSGFGSGSNHTVVVTEVPGDDKPEVPMIKPICGKRMFWSRVPNVEMYRIYRSRTPNFKIGADTFVTFVAEIHRVLPIMDLISTGLL